jgi:hydroxymethylbilane synthase
MSPIRIGTRGSARARAQSNWVKAQLQQHDPDLVIELHVIKTSGDRFAETPLQTLGNKGAFTKEIDDALLRGEIDLAVHSMKDLPTRLAPGLIIAAVPKREDPRDALVTPGKSTLRDLAFGTTVGTGSLRRRAQLLHHRSDLSIVPIRGNVDTRLRKLDEGQVGALVMAAAGLKRIGRADRISEILADEVCVSAVAQGALAIESREENALRDRLGFLDDPASRAEIAAERAMLDCLGGDCQVPIGARATASGGDLKMIGIVASTDGSRLCRSQITGSTHQAADLGRYLANQLLSRGADKLLAAAATER